MKKIAKAFSLVEVMVSLIVISTVVAVFTPTISKKIMKKVTMGSSIAAGDACKEFTSTRFEGTSDESCGICKLCDTAILNKRCLMCECDCPEGSIKDNRSCTCNSCPEKFPPDCLECNAGGCTKCDLSTGIAYFINNSKRCQICTAGSYCPDGTVKNTCPEGKYCPAGSKNAISCTPGKWGETGRSTDCTANCTAGYKCESGIRTICPEGTYSAAGASTCAYCPAGKWSSAGSTSSSSCTACPAGYACKDGTKTYCAAGTYSAAGASSCTTCEEGYYCTGGSAHAYCSAGKWGPTGRSTDCTACCSAGYACVNGSKTYCSAGTYSNGCTSSCSNCGAGHYCPGGSTRFACWVGSYSSATTATSTSTCQNCPAGTYLPYAGATSSSACTTCPAGQTSDAGASSCRNCGKEGCTGYSSGCNCNSCSEPTYRLDGTSCQKRIIPVTSDKWVSTVCTGTLLSYRDCENYCASRYFNGFQEQVQDTCDGRWPWDWVDASGNLWQNGFAVGSSIWGVTSDSVINNTNYVNNGYRDSSGFHRQGVRPTHSPLTCCCGVYYNAEHNVIRSYDKKYCADVYWNP